MPRQPSAVLQYKLRIKESLRRRIEQAAKKRGVSNNVEMVSRLELSFALSSIEDIAADMESVWARWSDVTHELNKQGDLLRVVEILLKQIDAGADNKTIKITAEKIRQVIASIDAEAKLLPRRMRTTGS
jgi:hypothetical protein